MRCRISIVLLQKSSYCRFRDTFVMIILKLNCSLPVFSCPYPVFLSSVSYVPCRKKPYPFISPLPYLDIFTGNLWEIYRIFLKPRKFKVTGGLMYGGVEMGILHRFLSVGPVQCTLIGATFGTMFREGVSAPLSFLLAASSSSQSG